MTDTVHRGCKAACRASGTLMNLILGKNYCIIICGIKRRLLEKSKRKDNLAGN